LHIYIYIEIIFFIVILSHTDKWLWLPAISIWNIPTQTKTHLLIENQLLTDFLYCFFREINEMLTLLHPSQISRSIIPCYSNQYANRYLVVDDYPHIHTNHQLISILPTNGLKSFRVQEDHSNIRNASYLLK
jgi:hypothetical protein